MATTLLDALNALTPAMDAFTASAPDFVSAVRNLKSAALTQRLSADYQIQAANNLRAASAALAAGTGTPGGPPKPASKTPSKGGNALAAAVRSLVDTLRKMASGNLKGAASSFKGFMGNAKRAYSRLRAFGRTKTGKDWGLGSLASLPSAARLASSLGGMSGMADAAVAFAAVAAPVAALAGAALLAGLGLKKFADFALETEQRNRAMLAEQAHLGEVNPTIAASLRMGELRKFQRDFASGQNTQDSFALLQQSTDDLSESLQPWKDISTNWENRLASVLARVLADAIPSPSALAAVLPTSAAIESGLRLALVAALGPFASLAPTIIGLITRFTSTSTIPLPLTEDLNSYLSDIVKGNLADRTSGDLRRRTERGGR